MQCRKCALSIVGMLYKRLMTIIEDLLPNLPRLQKLIACDCGLDSETMADLGRRYPHIRFVWRVKLGPLSARTDDTWFAPITKHQLIGGHDVDELKYYT